MNCVVQTVRKSTDLYLTLHPANGSEPLTRRYPDLSPPQAELDLEPFNLARVPAIALSGCSSYPQRLGQDQYRCVDCNVVWDIDEPRPQCILSLAQAVRKLAP